MTSGAPAPTPARAAPIERLLDRSQRFAQDEASGGIVLLACTAVALAWANSPWRESYAALWRTPLVVGAGGVALSKPLLLWINDGLMAVFFFVVGMEIKREVLIGDLASLRRAAFPIAAALGGMVAPAAIYLALNAGGPAVRGWGIPMATDIAFSLGVLALLGGRAPTALKVFLTALAIVDDIGAVLVIAAFYTAEISWASLAAAGAFLVVLLAANRAGVRRPLVYALLGLGLWFAVLRSGVHATVAGVLLAMTIPTSARIDADEFVARGRALLDDLESSGAPRGRGWLTEEQQAAVEALEAAAAQVQAPLGRLERTLHPWAAFAILPLFALANAGVAIGGADALSVRVVLGVVLGLVIGKPLGITLLAWLAARAGLAQQPAGVAWRQIAGAGVIAGIGFTMSLFISGLAFAETPALDSAKIGILAGSTIAGLLGWLVLGRAAGG